MEGWVASFFSCLGGLEKSYWVEHVSIILYCHLHNPESIIELLSDLSDLGDLSDRDRFQHSR